MNRKGHLRGGEGYLRRGEGDLLGLFRECDYL
jgi:hypothetical protein